MFLTRDALNSRALTDYDICIVGSGPAGLTIARNFLGTKKKVLILESGDGPDFDFTHDLMSGEVESGGSDGKLTYALPSGSGLHLSRYRGFGGTMNIWTGRIRPLDPSDFLRQTSLGGWLLNFDDMRQWYEMALKDFGIPSLDDYRLRPEDSSTVFYPIARQNSSDLSLKSWIRTNRNIGIDLYDAIAVSENIDCITDATANDIVVEGEISNNIV